MQLYHGLSSSLVAKESFLFLTPQEKSRKPQKSRQAYCQSVFVVTAI